MTNVKADVSAPSRPLLLWPGVIIVAMQWLGWWAVPIALPDATFPGILAGLAAGPLLLVWWAFFSRAPRLERWGGAGFVVLAMAVTPRLLHESVAKGNMGFQFFLWGIPIVSLAFVASVVASRGFSAGPRRATLIAGVGLACAGFVLLRSKGVTGDGMAEFTWRWTETAEQRLLTQAPDDPLALAPPAVPPAVADEVPDTAEGGDVASSEGSASTSPLAQGDVSEASAATRVEAAPEWPGFRGPGRTGVLTGIRVATDWSAAPPSQLWRRPIGPGVSSFAVAGGLLYTQEQRGESELVSCHNVSDGDLVWRHQDATRFYDTHVGAGPRATPALADGRVFTLGATGVLNAFDAADGRVLWSRNAEADTGAKRPLWGYVSSPLVVGDVLIVHAGALVGYDVATGEPRWPGPNGGSYSSPQLIELEGTEQVLLLRHAGMTGVSPIDGSVLWEHPWEGIGIMQPALTADGDVLMSMVDGGASPIGTRRVAVSQGSSGWTAKERWTSTRLKPSFSQVVVHEGHAYGFDGRFVACIDVAEGKRQWKGGRYGSGQLLLLPDQDALLVLSEEGDVALVRATPDGFEELARVPAIEGKTWNQPALVGDVLLVRNGEEMAAFKLPVLGG